MKCPNCGKEIPIHQQYCAFCGQKVEVDFDVIADSVVDEADAARATKIEQALMPLVALGVLANAVIFFYNGLHTETPRAEPSSLPALPAANLVLPRPQPPDPLSVAQEFDREVRLELPEFRPPPTRMLPGKLEPLRSSLMDARGADPRVAPAIDRGVKFLKSAEAKGNPLGMVNPNVFGARKPFFLISGTALAALGILGNGECWLDGDDGVQGAVTFLIVRMDRNSGQVQPATLEAVMNQALAVLAYSRGVLVSGDAKLREKGALCVKGLIEMQDASGAWLRPELMGRKRVPDLLRTAVALLALREATRAGVEVPPEAFESARAYAASTMSQPTGLSGENVPSRLHRKLDISPFLEPTALAAACRVFAGEGPSPDVMRQLKFMLDNPPSVELKLDSAHIYLGTAALQDLFERVPDRWMRPVADYLLGRQQSDGSWPCVTAREKDVGVIYPTAFVLMTLQCYFGR